MPSTTEDRLSQEETLQVLYFTGYTLLANARTLVGGWPQAYETAQLVHDAINSMRGPACGMARRVLGHLLKLDNLIMGDAVDRLAAERLGDLQLRSAEKGKAELDRLWQERRTWALQLCSILGVTPCQYSPLFDEGASSGSSINVPVRH